jgi:hypothetical protein
VNNTQPAWRRAARCVSEDNCVEILQDGQTIGVRNSTRPDVRITLSGMEFLTFINGIKRGGFNYP